MGLRQTQRVEQVRTLVNLIALSGPFTGISVLRILALGIYMALTAWKLLAIWIAVRRSAFTTDHKTEADRDNSLTDSNAAR